MDGVQGSLLRCQYTRRMYNGETAIERFDQHLGSSSFEDILDILYILKNHDQDASSCERRLE